MPINPHEMRFKPLEAKGKRLMAIIEESLDNRLTFQTWFVWYLADHNKYDSTVYEHQRDRARFQEQLNQVNDVIWQLPAWYWDETNHLLPLELRNKLADLKTIAREWLDYSEPWLPEIKY